MKRHLVIFSLWSIGVSLLLDAAAANRPNIVFIIADDMAWDDCTPYGHPTIQTPNLARLAKEGMRFDNAILTISSCSPSRCSIITGRYPHQTGAEELHWPLPAGQVTFVEHLKNAGYWTGAAGKWHLGEPAKRAFSEVREVDTSGFQLPTGAAGAEGKFKETLAGEAQSGCADWVPLLKARPRDRPFFLWLAALDPHRDFRENIIPEPHKPGAVRLPPYHPDTPEVRRDYTLYYDEIARLDSYVGRVLAELETQGVADETLIVFISDNGRAFPRDKTTVYDSGVKTPLIVRWPGRVKANTVAKGVVSSIDFAPTFLEVGGVAIGPTFQGRSLRPVLEDPRGVVRKYAFAEKNWHDFEDHVRAVRSERFKYIRNGYPDLPQTPPADAVRSLTFQEMLRLRSEDALTGSQSACFVKPRAVEEFYDVRSDPFELKNLAADPAYAAFLAEHRVALDTWEQETGDYVPRLRTADEFDREMGKPTPARVRPRRPRSEMVEKGLVAP